MSTDIKIPHTFKSSDFHWSGNTGIALLSELAPLTEAYTKLFPYFKVESLNTGSTVMFIDPTALDDYSGWTWFSTCGTYGITIYMR